VVFASLLSASDRGASAPIPSTGLRQGAAAVAAVAAIGLVVAWAPGLVDEWAWAQESSSGSVDAVAIAELAEASGDPSVAAAAVGMLVQEAEQNPDLASSNVELAQGLEPILESAAPWHVDAAYAGMALHVTMLGALEQGSWDDVDAYIQAGKLADPTSGLWDYVAAAQAERLGETERASEYAAQALEYPLPEAVRFYLEELAATS
jgi:hypothetical protein